MIRPLALAAVVLVPLAVAAPGTFAAEAEPAWATSPTTGSSGTDTSGDTGTATDTGTGAGDTTGDTATMPPVYEACGCNSAGEAGGWAALALLFTSGSPYRRRRPTTRGSCPRPA